MLLSGLDSLGSARELSAGQVEVWVTRGRDRRRVVVVMTAEEWDEMASVRWGDADDALADVKRTVSSLGAEHPYAVYGDYELEPSTTPVREDTSTDDDPVDTVGGHWFAYPPDRTDGRSDGRTPSVDERVFPG